MIRVAGIDADLIVYAVGFTLGKKISKGEAVNINHAQQITDTIIRKILRSSKATHYLGYLTYGPDNFRLALAQTLEYKGNRKKSKETPVPFKKEVTEYMIIHWGFQMMHGVEADDALVIAGEYFRDKPETYILATKDKDLWQWEGEHYNMNINELMIITPEEAHRNLWKQVITGDMGTDNIPGLSHAAKGYTEGYKNPKVRPLGEHLYGDKNKLLEDVDPVDYPKVVLEEYLWAYGSIDPEDESWTDLGLLRFYETFALVYMLPEAPSDLKIHYKYRKCTEEDLRNPYGFSGYSTIKSEF